jgi:hypothetical protein
MIRRGWKPVAVMILLGGMFSAETAAQERKVTVLPSDLPSVIRKAIEQAFPKGQIIRIQKEVEGEDPGQYDVDIRSDAKLYEVEISPEGEVIESKEVGPAETAPSAEQGKKWTENFNQEHCTFLSVGRNRFFSLEPGDQLVLESDSEKVAITVLEETKMIGRIKTRIVEEREEKNGKLAEVSRNFFAICREHGDVFYFGEEVDDYKDGKIVAHSGAWRADEPDSKAGIIMPGTILLGARHYQEIAPNAMDRAEIISDDVTMKTPAGTFTNCLRVEETSGLDPDEKCYKTYAPGVGLIQDEDLLLTGYTKAQEQSLSLKDVPRRVRAAMKKHAAGGKITEIEKGTADGALVYEAEVVLNGKQFDILVSAKGKYLGTEKQEEADDQQGKEDDEDNDEDEKDEADEDENSGESDQVAQLFDDFDNEFDLSWDVLGADPSHWSLSKVPGTLTITTQTGSFTRGRTDYENIFLVDFPVVASKDFQITTCLKGFKPVEFWNQAGLLLWNDENNHLRFVYEYGEGPPVYMTKNPRQFTTGIEIGGLVRHAWFRAEQEPDEVWLRVIKRRSWCELYTGTDGKTFHPVELILARFEPSGNRVPWPGGSVKRVGLYASNGGALDAREVEASFDFFEVRELSEVAQPDM